MKKFYVALILILSLFFTGCFKNPVEPNENSIIFKLPDDYNSVLSVSEIPTFEFKFNGTLNTALYSDPYAREFTNNDSKILSDGIENLLEDHKDRTYIVRNRALKTEQALFSKLDKYGNIENEEYTPDNKMIYDETAYISLRNGLKLTVDYERFIYNGENYYTWKFFGNKAHNITMYMYYPMMAIKDGLVNKIVLITLPNAVTFSVGPNLKISSLLNEKTYLDKEEGSVYYTFKYIDIKELPADDKEFDGKDKDKLPELTEEEKQKLIRKRQQYVIDYYVKDYDAVYDSEKKTLTYSYLGNKFRVDLFDDNFKMHYIG